MTFKLKIFDFFWAPVGFLIQLLKLLKENTSLKNGIKEICYIEKLCINL